MGYVWLGLVLFLGVGCASLDGRRQTLFVEVSSGVGEVVAPEAAVGETSRLVNVERQTSALFLKTDAGLQKVKLQSRYRWVDSFFANFIFLGFAPVGWVVDLITGAAWEIENPGPIDLPALAKNKGHLEQQKSHSRLRLVVAPPRAGSQRASDEVGEQIISRLRIDPSYSKFEIMDYRTSLDTIRENDADSHQGEIGENQIRDVLYALKANAMVTSTLRNDDKNIIVNGSIYRLGQTKLETFTLEIPKTDLEYAKESLWADEESTSTQIQ